MVKEKSSTSSKSDGKRKDVEKPATDNTVPVAPDGGYGWVILFASLMINIIVDGIIFSFGVLSDHLSEVFKSSTSATAWVGSMMAGFYLLAGPIVSGLCNTYGARKITMIGSFLAAGSIAISCFSTGLAMMMVFYGLIAGVGLGFVYLPAIVIVGEYFEKRRALATGLAVSGSGIGGFTFVHLFRWLLNEFNVRGAILVIAGISLNCAVFGALFRPLKPARKVPVEDAELQRSESFLKRIQDAKDARIRKLNADSQVDGLEKEGALTPRHPLLDEQNHLTKIAENDQDLPRVIYSSTDIDVRLSDVHSPANRRLSISSRKSIHSNTFRPDTFYSGSLQNLPEVKAVGSIRDFREAISNQQIEQTDSSYRSCLPESIAIVFRQMLDVSLLKNPVFLLTCFTSFLTLAGFFIPFVYIKDLVEFKGIDESQAVMILSAISVTNTIGRIIVGWISDFPQVSPIVVACSSLIVGGIATCFAPFYDSVAILMIYALVFGFCIAAFAALRSIILVDLFGIALLNNSFGLQMTFQGVATLIGSPIGGAIRDATGSFDGTFYFGGALLAISGALLLPAKTLQRWDEKRRKRSTTKGS